MNLYGNFSGVLSAMTTHKLCGAAESDFLYLAEIHFGYTPRGPLNFGRGYYLRNGTSTKAPILAAAGDEFRLPFLVALFDTKTAVMLPPLDLDKNPTNKVTETLRSMTSKEHGVTFRFAIEVGMKRLQREEFEWRKMVGKQDGDDGSLKGSRYTLVRLAPDFPVASSSKALSPDLADEDCETVAELAFGNIMLELKGAGSTGELGERWSLMVVMTALGIHWLRQYGKTNKATVGAAQKLNSK
ncbi:hypothetical protein NEMBOFW57_004540 [Staphylotrichum longicolle]|uniref:Uncharacterized protein n=1 Tax=Staphylotrichum longicolle TaxID=669026 RepID=A0AAD4I3R2_9PEZI|nr:hypothetical protein NEMBOFW57_004540 [Staphylotrichum longicolle]